MSENVLAHTGDDVSHRERPLAFETILYGGLAVGVLDALDAVTFYGLRGVSPARVFQSVASGLLGADAFQGGLATALFGLPLHFLIALIIAAIYYGLSLRLPILTRQAVASGLIYGLVVYYVMNYVVVPLSAAPHFKSSYASALNGVIGHAVLVGLPVALIVRRSASGSRTKT